MSGTVLPHRNATLVKHKSFEQRVWHERWVYQHEQMRGCAFRCVTWKEMDLLVTKAGSTLLGIFQIKNT